MEYEFRMANVLGLLKNLSTSPITPSVENEQTGNARIVEDGTPMCNRFNRKNCYDPDSLKKAFHPLGIFSKIFGLFPCYDFSFVEKLSGSPNSSRSKISIIHFLDYCYSGLIFGLLTGGAILCLIYKPTILQGISFSDKDDENLSRQVGFDYYVKLSLIFATLFAGVPSLFIFPMKWNSVLAFVKLISNVDKILRFDGRQEERWFARKVLYYMIGCSIFALVSFLILFVHDGNNESPCVMDYLLAPVMSLALMALVIPTGLAIFFLNALRLRMEQFNCKLGNILRAFIPSSGNCVSFQDYGNELTSGKTEMDKQKLYDFPENLEKMRILHCEIRSLGNVMSCIFGFHLVRDFMYSMVALTLYTYYLIFFHEEGIGIVMIYAGHGIFIILKVFVLVSFTQLILCQGAVLEGMLQRVSLRLLSESCCLQIQTFLSIASKPPVISASGFFNVNKALITSILASITTYFIILIQFKLNGRLTSGSLTTGTNVTNSSNTPMPFL